MQNVNLLQATYATTRSLRMRYLHIIMNMRWKNNVSNNKVLLNSNTEVVEALIIAAQIRWCERVLRMDDCRLLKILLYGELKEAK